MRIDRGSVSARDADHTRAERRRRSAQAQSVLDELDQLSGVVTRQLDQILEARLRDVDEEHKSERLLNWLS
jgi:hypothetical protein